MVLERIIHPGSRRDEPGRFAIGIDYRGTR